MIPGTSLPRFNAENTLIRSVADSRATISRRSAPIFHHGGEQFSVEKIDGRAAFVKHPAAISQRLGC